MPPNVLALYNKLNKLPFGKSLFGTAFCLVAPYFYTIRPAVLDMKPGFASVKMQNRNSIGDDRGHIHDVAVCNLVEMCMGMVAEATIPKNLRWIPMGMDISYLDVFDSTLTATSTIDENNFFSLDKYPGQVQVPVLVKDDAGKLLCTASVRLWISEISARPKKE